MRILVNLILFFLSTAAFSQSQICEIQSLIDQKSYTKAYFRANEMLKNDPGNAELYYYKAKCLIGVGETGLSIHLLHKSTELDSTYFEPWFQLGEIMYEFISTTLYTYPGNRDELYYHLAETTLEYYVQANAIRHADVLVQSRIEELKTILNAKNRPPAPGK